MSPIKTAVAAAFSAAAESYDAGADIQRLVADRLARRIKALTLPASARILEIGCGTGFLSSELTGIEAADLVITDISGAMLARCRQRLGTQSARFLVMDGENPNPAAGSGFDLICSSLAFQWFDDLSVALTRLASLLAPGGYLAFATLGAESFKEWHNAHLALQLPSAVKAYPTAEGLSRMLPGACWVEDEHFVQHHTDGHGFLKQLKRIGAHHPVSDHRPLTPGTLRRVLRRFEGGISVTYHIAYGIWQRGA